MSVPLRTIVDLATSVIKVQQEANANLIAESEALRAQSDLPRKHLALLMRTTCGVMQ